MNNTDISPTFKTLSALLDEAAAVNPNLFTAEIAEAQEIPAGALYERRGSGGRRAARHADGNGV